HQQQKHSEGPPQRQVPQPPRQLGTHERSKEQADRDDRRVRDIHLTAPVVLERAQKPHGEQQRRERRTLRRVLGQSEEEHETRNDEDGASDAEQPGYHAGREADQTHQHPVHHASPCSGFPHAPPPGVSMRSTSPGWSSVLTLDATGVPFKIVRPAAPCPPPAAPAGSWRRRSASTLSSIGANASNSRTTPSPPAHHPTPPLPRRKP